MKAASRITGRMMARAGPWCVEKACDALAVLDDDDVDDGETAGRGATMRGRRAGMAWCG